jgi:NAD(P)-dependent dehydrogenase (short-subunit alcohol dehydrogenase family)
MTITKLTTTAHQTPARFTGKTAIITGAASGIGLATSRRLLGEGARVVMVDLSRTVIDAARDLVGAVGGPRHGTAAGVVGDVADIGTWNRAVATAREAGGAVDVLVSSAFINPMAALHDLTLDAWQHTLGVNLTGAYLGLKATLPDLRERRGSVVLVSSVHALFGMPGHPAYAVSKGGLGALTRQLAVEYGTTLRVNVVLPGPILTPTWEGVDTADRNRSIEGTVLKRFGAPEEVASAIAFLASSDASFITGASLLVDGGWSIAKDSA